MDLQLVLVLLIVIAAAIYAARRLLRQFHVSEDEPAGCASCAANPEMQEKASADPPRLTLIGRPRHDGPGSR